MGDVGEPDSEDNLCIIPVGAIFTIFTVTTNYLLSLPALFFLIWFLTKSFTFVHVRPDRHAFLSINSTICLLPGNRPKAISRAKASSTHSFSGAFHGFFFPGREIMKWLTNPSAVVRFGVEKCVTRQVINRTGPYHSRFITPSVIILIMFLFYFPTEMPTPWKMLTETH